MKKQNLIGVLKAWLKKKKTNRVRLTYELGYSSETTILAWLKQGKIPTYKEKEVENVIKSNH